MMWLYLFLIVDLFFISFASVIGLDRLPKKEKKTFRDIDKNSSIDTASQLEIEGDRCKPNAQTDEGVCTLITECDEASRSVLLFGKHNFLRCGFQGKWEIVCCPQTENKFGGTTSTTSAPISRSTKRTADRECEKLVNNGLPPFSLHIIGGENASLGEFPHMVALGYDRGQGYSFDCGGALISTRFVLTAVHCIDTLDGIEPEMIRAGVTDIGESDWNEKTDVRIAEIIKHPDYKRREKYHDIALIRLQKAVEVGFNVNPSCLYTAEEDPRSELTVTGWGATGTRAGEERSRFLLKTNVTIVDRSQCSQRYLNWRKLPNGVSSGQLCAGDTDGKRDSCQGDSGGPLQSITSNDGYYRIVGITSFGRGCASAVPAVYTRVSAYVDWIERVVWPGPN